MESWRLDPSELRRRFTLPGTPADWPAWRAAVLVPFIREADDWHLLFIRRAERAGDEHSGQVAFPGGRAEPCDSGALACALRETHEEIGLPASRVEVLGSLPLQCTRAGYPVQPIVGIAPWPVALRPDPGEVAHCFTVPLAWLANPANRRPVRYLAADGRIAQVAGFHDYQGEHVWGLTARIVLDVLTRLGRVASAKAPLGGTITPGVATGGAGPG